MTLLILQNNQTACQNDMITFQKLTETSIYYILILNTLTGCDLSINLSIYISIHLYIYVSIYLPIYLSIYLSIYVSIYYNIFSDTEYPDRLRSIRIKEWFFFHKTLSDYMNVKCYCRKDHIKNCILIYLI